MTDPSIISEKSSPNMKGGTATTSRLIRNDATVINCCGMMKRLFLILNAFVAYQGDSLVRDF